MIKYFKELENRENQYLDLIENTEANFIDLDYLPLNFFQKYQNLFLLLMNLDVLYINALDNKKTKKFLNDKIDKSVDLEAFYSNYLNQKDVSNYLTIQGKNRMDILVYQFYKYNKENYEHLEQYISAIIELFFIEKNQYITWNKYKIEYYLNSVKIVAKYQNKLPKNIEMLIEDALKELEKYKFEIREKNQKPVDLKLPNSWYITPYKHLYNSMGKDGHKEANLFYPFYYTILRDNKNLSPIPYLKAIQRIKQNGFITSAEYEEYLNLKYEFPCIYPEFYYHLNPFQQIIYQKINKKSYNPKLTNLIIGIESAHAGFYNFFYRLKQCSSNYEQNLIFLKELDFNDMLVRCCGFHKVTSLPDKIITTSLINYEDEFKEYIKRDWKIDFLPPFILNEQGLLEEYPKEFLTIRKILK